LILAQHIGRILVGHGVWVLEDGMETAPGVALLGAWNMGGQVWLDIIELWSLGVKVDFIVSSPTSFIEMLHCDEWALAVECREGSASDVGKMSGSVLHGFADHGFMWGLCWWRHVLF